MLPQLRFTGKNNFNELRRTMAVEYKWLFLMDVGYQKLNQMILDFSTWEVLKKTS